MSAALVGLVLLLVWLLFSALALESCRRSPGMKVRPFIGWWLLHWWQQFNYPNGYFWRLLRGARDKRLTHWI